MFGELLIIMVGFLKWTIKGFRTNLNEEISGLKENPKNVRGQNYLIGIIIVLILIFIFS